jgi:hypothetical protein
VASVNAEQERRFHAHVLTWIQRKFPAAVEVTRVYADDSPGDTFNQDRFEVVIYFRSTNGADHFYTETDLSGLWNHLIEGWPA